MVTQRSALFGLMLSLGVLGATACEDKTPINIEPDVPPLTITVTPPSVEITEGQTAQLVAQVTGGEQGGDKSVTWASSNTSVATISANGNVVTVNGVAEGTATISATANADPNVTGAGVVKVNAAAGNVPPTISIKSITTGATNTPVVVNNVFGQIEITLNLDVPQGTQIDRVEVLANGVEIYRQGFSGAELSLAADEAQSAVELVASWNTAKFDASALGTAGNVKGDYDNGPTEIVAQVIGPQGTVTANTSQTITLNNTPFIYTRLNYPATNAFNVGTSLIWYTGDIVIDALGVRFNDNATQDLSQISVTNTGSDVATSTDMDGSDGFKLTLQKSGGSAGSRIDALESAGVTFTLAAVTAGGAAGPGCVVTENSPTPLNISCAVSGGAMTLPSALNWDNVAPTITLFDLTPLTIGCGASACYINGAFAFAIRPGFFAATDAGVGSVTAMFKAGTSSSTLMDVATGADLPESVTADTYITAATVKDALGNSRTQYASLGGVGQNSATGAQQFGVDYTPPTMTFASGPANMSVNPATTTWTLSASDGGVGPSGFSTTPFSVNLKLWRPVTPSETCYTPDGTFPGTPAGSCTNSSGIIYTTDDGVVPINAVVGPNDPYEGYWLIDAFASDLAKNVSSPNGQRITLWDQTAPTAVGVAFPLPLNGGTQTAFSTLAFDNVELASGQGSLSYNVGAYVLKTEQQTLPGAAYGPQDGFTGGVTGINAGFTVPALIKSLQTFGGAVNALDGASVWVYDYAGASSPTATQAIQAAGVTNGFPSFTNAQMTGYTDPTATNATVCVSTGGSGCAGASKTSTVLSATATGSTAGGQTFANPFTNVSFWWQEGGAGTTWRQLPGTVTTTVSENSTTQIRTWTYSLNLTTTGLDVTTNGTKCPTALGFTSLNVVAIGATSTGTGVVSVTPFTVTMSCT